METISSDGISESEAKDYVTSVLETVQPPEGGNILIDIIFKIVSQIFPGTTSDSNIYQTSDTEISEPSEDSYGYETPTYTSSETPEDTNYYDSTTYENPEMHEEL